MKTNPKQKQQEYLMNSTEQEKEMNRAATEMFAELKADASDSKSGRELDTQPSNEVTEYSPDLLEWLLRYQVRHHDTFTRRSELIAEQMTNSLVIDKAQKELLSAQLEGDIDAILLARKVVNKAYAKQRATKSPRLDADKRYEAALSGIVQWAKANDAKHVQRHYFRIVKEWYGKDPRSWLEALEAKRKSEGETEGDIYPDEFRRRLLKEEVTSATDYATSSTQPWEHAPVPVYDKLSAADELEAIEDAEG